jgi:SAM-dependent methyltransferase
MGRGPRAARCPAGTVQRTRSPRAASVRRGEAVLDVGCGCGATTATLGELVGTSGRVVGLDLSAPMLDRALQTITAPHVELVLGDAAAVQLPEGRFDLLFSRFGVMFFEDPVAAFAHLRGALRTTGWISLIVWQPLEANGWVTIPSKAVADLVELPSLGGPEEPGPFSLGDANHLRARLSTAGYADIELADEKLELTVGGDLPLDEAATFTVEHGPLRRALADAPDAIRSGAVERIARALAPYETSYGVRLPAAVWVVTARAS